MLHLLWTRFTLRHWLRTPKTSVVLMLVLALGVGVFLSIRLANRAAVAGFSLFTESITGESDYTLLPPGGDLPTSILGELRQSLDTFPVGLFPVVETVAMDETRPYTLLGLDLIGLQNAAYLEADDPPVPSADRSTRVQQNLLGSSSLVVISSALADRDSLAAGDRFTVLIGEDEAELEVAFIAPDIDFAPPRPANLLVMDLPGLQRLTGREGRIDRVEVRLAEGSYAEQSRPQVEAQLAALSQSRWRVETPASQRATGDTMTRAFRFNLTILSGLALLVGVYLILQALEAAVVRRRSEIAILRSLGVPPSAIHWSWLIESLSLGVVGTVLGIGLGWLGAQVAVRAVSQTVNALYYANTATAAGLVWSEVALATVLGIGASLLAGWLPARDAARTPPAQMLRRGVRDEGLSWLRKPWLGLVLVLVGLACYYAPPLRLPGGIRLPVAGYACALCWVIGAGILCGPLFGLLPLCSERLARRFPGMRYAMSHFRRPSGRHRLTVAGLLVAVGMAAGMSILIFSFEVTMKSWINQMLKADLYAAPRGMQTLTSPASLRADTWRALQADPDVLSADVGRRFQVEIEGLPTILGGARISDESRDSGLIWVQAPKDEETLTPTAGQPAPALASESFSARFGCRRGDILRLPTPGQERDVQLIGIFADYGNEQGSILLDGETVANWYDDDRATSIAAWVKPGADAEAVARRWVSAYPGLEVRTTAELRAEVLRIFHQTFSITYALKGLGVAVAVIGLALALISLLIERKRELTTLKELGMSRRGIARAACFEGVGIAGIGLSTGLVLSVALGALLIYVINKQSFGWTLAFRVPIGQLAFLAGMVLLTSAFVSYSVGYWGAGLPSDQEE